MKELNAARNAAKHYQLRSTSSVEVDAEGEARVMLMMALTNYATALEYQETSSLNLDIPDLSVEISEFYIQIKETWAP